MHTDQEPPFHPACPVRSPPGAGMRISTSGPHSMSLGTLIIIGHLRGHAGFPLVPCQGEGQTGCVGRRGKLQFWHFLKPLPFVWWST